MKNKKYILAMVIFMCAFKAHALDFVSEKKQDVKVINADTEVVHAQSYFLIEEVLKHSASEYVLTLKGEGDYGQYKNVDWIKMSNFILNKEFLQPLRTIETIRKLSKEIIVQYSKAYDYEKNEATFLKTNNHGKVILRKIFPIKGPICDETNLVHFLRFYAAHFGEEEYDHFYLLTNEPKLYKVLLKDLGVEALDLLEGKVDAQKIQIMADLGPLTELAIKFVTATYVWFSLDTEHRWLQYEGKDSGPDSQTIRAFVE